MITESFTLEYSYLKQFSGYLVGHGINSIFKVENVRLVSYLLPQAHSRISIVIIEGKDVTSLISASYIAGVNQFQSTSQMWLVIGFGKYNLVGIEPYSLI